MNPKQILATHRVWRLFNRKGRVTTARLQKALGKSIAPATAVGLVTKAYGVPIHKDGDTYEVGRARPGRKAAKTTSPEAL